MLDSIKGEYLTKHRSYTMSVSITQAYIHDLVRNCLACLFFVPVSHGKFWSLQSSRPTKAALHSLAAQPNLAPNVRVEFATINLC